MSPQIGTQNFEKLPTVAAVANVLVKEVAAHSLFKNTLDLRTELHIIPCNTGAAYCPTKCDEGFERSYTTQCTSVEGLVIVLWWYFLGPITRG